MNKFEICGIKSPGLINLPVFGTIELEKIDDDLAETLWKEGLPFLKPKPDFLDSFYPDKNPRPQSLKYSKRKSRN